ncbi:MAG: hypothetical protein JWO69_2048 [Thermoleophilia bacterium]|nr:hypothetical protein [Thermoleophilia bacterium]
MTPAEATALLAACRTAKKTGRPQTFTREQAKVRVAARNKAVNDAHTALRRLYHDDYRVLFDAAFQARLAEVGQ